MLKPTATVAIEKLKPHWTDSHISYDEVEGVFIAYDEAGQEHSRSPTLNEARDSLVVYEATLNSTS